MSTDTPLTPRDADDVRAEGSRVPQAALTGKDEKVAASNGGDSEESEHHPLLLKLLVSAVASVSSRIPAPHSQVWRLRFLNDEVSLFSWQAHELKCAPEDIVDFELNVCDTQPRCALSTHHRECTHFLAQRSSACD